ncbi:lipoate--protein ligase [Plebeiibacterium marinum]|uniref:lipoate--protein ligase n=1 Tax=Plebeiibacterium marinum TaxID=2992111 RepID=A0AAE3MG74_9BACT|nr:lipoate--protein ligase [Plebeiobacterium marinum]MCW3807006.1 lipoate--protein ligase [Plebeiobacterium marinum]
MPDKLYMNMRIILSKNNDPYINIATEEYLLKNFEEDIFFLYRNTQSIIVGKHQNTLAELNYSFVNKEEIPVIRRLSGGGTVFHDLGNLNFCFITKGEKGELVNFKKFISPIVDFLQSLNIDASIGGRNDILINGCKISGNASHVFKSRVMHHGTLLYKSELSSLTQALKSDPLKFKDKAVKSVRSKVTNIHEHITDKKEINAFTDELYKYIHTNYQGKPYELNKDDYSVINLLVNKKYNTWEWNYGYSPKYILKKRIKSKTGKRFEFILNVQKGLINEVEIKSNSIKKIWLNKLQEELKNKFHDKKSLQISLSVLFEENPELDLEEFLQAIF